MPASRSFLASLLSTTLGCTEPETLADRVAISPDPTGSFAEALASFDVSRAPPPPSMGRCAGGGASVVGGQAFTSIAAGIAAASSLPIVWICPGVWAESLTIPWGGRVALIAMDPRRGSTTLTGSGSRRILTVQSSSPSSRTVVWLRNLTFIDGQHVDSGGAIDASDADLTLDGCAFRDNHAGYQGGAVHVSDAGIFQMRESIFLDNTADHEGGALEVYQDPSAMTPMTLVDNHFEGNRAGYDAGGAQLGIRWAPMNAVLRGNSFVRNEAGYEGGGLTISGSSGRVSMQGDGFLDNGAPQAGAGFDWSGWDLGDLEAVDVTMIGNRGAAWALGGVGTAPGRATIHGGRVLRNEVGLAASSGWQVAVHDVDFGTAADDNVVDVDGCAPQGAHATFDLYPAAGVWCL